MRTSTVAAVVALALTLGDAASGIAQIWRSDWPAWRYSGNRALTQWSSNGPSPGLFGDRVVGQALWPGPVGFGGVAPLSPREQPAGMALYNGGLYQIPAQPAQFSLPSYGPAIGVDQRGQAVDQWGQALQVQEPIASPYPVPAPQNGAEPMPATSLPATQTPAQSAAPEAGAALGGSASRSLTHRWPGSPGARLTQPVGPFVSSPQLSARMMRLARAGGVRTPSGISVLVGNGTAILQGTVGSASDRALLSNLLAMEPGIWQVDNRLTVAGEGAASGALKR